MAESVEHRDGSDAWLLRDAEYQELKSAADTLRRLRAAGVDNWEGYGRALRDGCENCGDPVDDNGTCYDPHCATIPGHGA